MGRQRCAGTILISKFDVSAVKAREDILFVGSFCFSYKYTGHVIGGRFEADLIGISCS